jgi:hypothetical protein
MNEKNIKEIAVAVSIGYIAYRLVETRRVVNKLIRIHNQRVFDTRFENIIKNEYDGRY